MKVTMVPVLQFNSVVFVNFIRAMISGYSVCVCVCVCVRPCACMYTLRGSFCFVERYQSYAYYIMRNCKAHC